jgi:DNA-binding transcriptional LysR family regulator
MTLLRNAPLLRQFLAVVREGTITAAAESLSMTQPALTKSIQKLESELNAKLFERLPRGLSLTLFGKMLLPHAQRIDADCRLGDLELRAFDNGQTGLLKVGAGHLFEASAVPTAFARMNEVYPGVKFQLVSGTMQKTYALLLSGELDLMFGLLPPQEEIPGFLACSPILELTQRIIAAASHPLVAAKEVSVNDFAEYPWVVLQRDLSLVNMLFSLLTQEGAKAPRINVEVTSLSSLVRLLKSGTHLSVFAEAFNTIQDLGLAFVPCPHRLTRGKAGVVYHRSLERYGPAVMLMDLVRREADKSVQLSMATC